MQKTTWTPNVCRIAEFYDYSNGPIIFSHVCYWQKGMHSIYIWNTISGFMQIEPFEIIHYNSNSAITKITIPPRVMCRVQRILGRLWFWATCLARCTCSGSELIFFVKVIIVAMEFPLSGSGSKKKKKNHRVSLSGGPLTHLTQYKLKQLFFFTSIFQLSTPSLRAHSLITYFKLTSHNISIKTH